jgi:hypothetical protein
VEGLPDQGAKQGFSAMVLENSTMDNQLQNGGILVQLPRLSNWTLFSKSSSLLKNVPMIVVIYFTSFFSEKQIISCFLPCKMENNNSQVETTFWRFLNSIINPCLHICHSNNTLFAELN